MKPLALIFVMAFAPLALAAVATSGTLAEQVSSR